MVDRQTSGAQSQRLIVVNAHVVDPGRKIDESGHLVAENGEILACGPGPVPDALSGGEGPATRIDARGLVLAPGLVDMHVHFREPGQEDKETIASGSEAAARGGFTAVVTMPNTSPPVDNAGAVELVRARGREAGRCSVHPAGALSLGLAGKQMVEYAELVDAGAVAFTDDGEPVRDAGLLRRAMEYSRILGVPIISHAEEKTLSGQGVMNEGSWSTRLGLRGIPNAAEVVAVARDIELVRLTGARLHFAHISCAGSVELIRRAKDEGLPLTAETAPHYLDLSEEDCGDYDSRFKMNPPLRSMEDQEALLAGLADGSLDCIATDHAPHTPSEKNRPFGEAPFGVIGLETALSVCHDRLVRRGSFELSRLVELMSTAPAGIMGLTGGSLAPGSPADFTLIDTTETWTPRHSDLGSKGQNCPWLGRTLTARVVATHLATRFTHQRAAGRVAEGEA